MYSDYKAHFPLLQFSMRAYFLDLRMIMIPCHELVQVFYLGKYVCGLKAYLGESIENLEEVGVFKVKWPNVNFTVANPILELVSYL